jgi:hypothetical protein
MLFWQVMVYPLFCSTKRKGKEKVAGKDNPVLNITRENALFGRDKLFMAPSV